MNYLTALKTARDHFGMDAVTIMSEDRCLVSELIEAAETSPVQSGFEVRIRTDQQVTTSLGTEIPAWAIYDELSTTEGNGEDEEGAHHFGWQGRDLTPRTRRDGQWLLGTGVAASTFPTIRAPANALIRAYPDERYSVLIDASDIGTGACTVLTQIAAEALEASLEQVELQIGDSSLPRAFVAGGSSGTASWGSAVIEAARKLRDEIEEAGGSIPEEGIEASGSIGGPTEDARRYSMHAFGAQFAEVRVDLVTGEVRVPRLLGMFAAGRIINPAIAHSQLIGGMSMGLSMALHEQSVVDGRFGHYANRDFAEYHIATAADIGDIDVGFVEEEDPYVNPLGSKGIGELGIVGTAAAVANAVYNATGIRVRELPITPDKLLG